MHYKRTAALLKIIHRAKGKMEKILQEVVEDVVRNPDKYSTKEKIMIWQFLSRKYYGALYSMGTSVGNTKILSRRHIPTVKKL